MLNCDDCAIPKTLDYCAIKSKDNLDNSIEKLSNLVNDDDRWGDCQECRDEHHKLLDWLVRVREEK